MAILYIGRSRERLYKKQCITEEEKLCKQLSPYVTSLIIHHRATIRHIQIQQNNNPLQKNHVCTLSCESSGMQKRRRKNAQIQSKCFTNIQDQRLAGSSIYLSVLHFPCKKQMMNCRCLYFLLTQIQDQQRRFHRRPNRQNLTKFKSAR